MAAGEPIANFQPHDASSSIALKPVAVIYFTGHGSHSEDYADAIKNMILQAKRELNLTISDYPLQNEAELATTIDHIADGDTGFIIVLEPHDIPALIKIPSLYPDIHFSVIGVAQPLYLINVNSMIFKEQEGTFISGVIAALQSTSGTISFISKEDVPYTRNLAYAYFQGAKYINPNIQVVQQLGGRSLLGNTGIAKQQVISSKNADIAFVQDDELLDAALRTAKEQKQRIIAATPHLLNNPNILTGLQRHYDFALYTVLRNYAHHSWAPVTENIGLDNSYIDYVVDAKNRDLFSKDTIERIERTKDLVSQGIITIAPLSP